MWWNVIWIHPLNTQRPTQNKTIKQKVWYRIYTHKHTHKQTNTHAYIYNCLNRMYYIFHAHGRYSCTWSLHIHTYWRTLFGNCWMQIWFLAQSARSMQTLTNCRWATSWLAYPTNFRYNLLLLLSTNTRCLGTFLVMICLCDVVYFGLFAASKGWIGHLCCDGVTNIIVILPVWKV